MFIKENSQEKIKFLEEKINSLHNSLGQLNPPIAIKPLQISDSKEFSLDPKDQAAYRTNFLKSISDTPTLKPLTLYSKFLEAEYISPRTTPEILIKTLKKLFNKSIDSQKFHHSQLQVQSLNKPKKSQDPKIEENLEKIKETSSFLSKLSNTTESNFGTFLQISDLFQIVQQNFAALDKLQPFYYFYYTLSWLDSSQKPTILKKYANFLIYLKNSSISRMKLLTSDPNIGKINKKVKIVTNINAKNIERQKEMMKKVHAQHSTFAEEHFGINEEILNSHLSDFDLPPVLISSTLQLNTILENICKEFGLISNLVQDDGHTITYQITYLFPQVYEIQKHKIEWIPYGDVVAKDLQKKKLQKLPNKITKISNIKKKSSSSEIEETIKVEYKVVCIKEQDWKGKIRPDVFDWEKKQESRIRNILKNDALLENSFHMLSIQNFNSQVQLLEEFSMIYPEKSSKKGRLRHEFGESQSESKTKYLTGLLNDKASSQLTEIDTSSLSTYNIKSVYTLKLLKSRDLKNKIIQILNVFKSFERLFSVDLETLEKVKTDDLEKLKFDYKPDVIESIENEYYVKDGKDEYIIYDTVLEEYSVIENWLICLGTFFIEKHELIFDHSFNHYPPIDRDFLMGELLEEHHKFLLCKLQLVFVLVKIYKAVVDRRVLKKLIELISKIILMRPRINLTNSYFAQSYWAHCAVLSAQQRFFEAYYNKFVSEDQYTDLGLNKTVKVFYLVARLLEDLALDLKIICPKEKSIIECVIWEESLIKLENLPNKTETKLNWENFSQGLKLVIEDSVKGKIKTSDNEKVNYADLCLNLWTMSQSYEKLIKTSWHVKILKSIYSAQLLNAKKEEVGPLLAISPGQRVENSNFFQVFELFPELSDLVNLMQPTSAYSLVAGPGLDLLQLIVNYEIWSKQFLQIAVQVNLNLTDVFTFNITELEIAQEQNFIFKNSKINWMLILGRKGEGIIPEKVQQEIKRLNSRIQTCNGFIDIYSMKMQKRAEYKETSEPINYSKKIKWFCSSIQSLLYSNAKCCQILKIIKETNKILAIIPEKTLEKVLAKSQVKVAITNTQVNLNNLDYFTETILGYLNKSEKQSLDLDTLLQNQLSLLRYTQIMVLVNSLKFNKAQFLEICELSTIEKQVNPEDPENLEEAGNENVPERAEIISFLELFTNIISIKTDDWTLNLNQVFYIFADALNGLSDKLLRKINEFETQVLKDTISEIFGFDINAEIFWQFKDSILNVCEKFKIEHKNHKYPGKIMGGFLGILDVGLLDLKDNSRAKIFKLFEEFCKNIINVKTEKIEEKIKFNLLKALFIEYKAAQSKFSVNYADCLQIFNDFTEDLDHKDPDFSKISILKNYFIEELCLFGIQQLEILFLNFNFKLNLEPTSYFSCNFDHIEHDPSSKIGVLPNFMNSLRNRSSRVETPTGGYALVFYLKDLTSSLRKLTNSYMHYNEAQYWSELRVLKLQIEFLSKKFSAIDSLAGYFSAEVSKITKNFESIVNLSVTQKGSEIIYNLDSIRRQLNEVQENTKQLENLTRIIIDNEFRERLETKDREIKDFLKYFKSFQEEIYQNLNNDLEFKVSAGISTIMPYSSKIKRVLINDIYSDTNENVQMRKKTELKKLQSELTLIRIFNKLAKVFNKDKVDKEIGSLKAQLASNQAIWEELNHTQRRETILKQELATAQSILSASEKNIEKLQKDIEEINSKRLRLQMFRDNKTKQVQELQEMIKIEKNSKEKQKKLAELMKDQSKIRELQKSEFEAGQEFLTVLQGYEGQVKKLKFELDEVRKEKEDAFERLDELRKEIDLRNQGGNWKEKFLTLSRNLTNSTTKSFGVDSSRTQIRVNESYNQLSFKSKSPTLPKIGQKNSFRAL